MRAVVLREVGRPTAVEQVALRPVNSDEVRVQLAASGVCHTDLSVRDGQMPALLPCTLGHEGAGVVVQAGDDVTTVGPGDHVVLTWNVPCRSCPHCLRGEAQLCPHGLNHAFGAPYAESADGPLWPSMGPGRSPNRRCCLAPLRCRSTRRSRSTTLRCWAARSRPGSAR